MTNQLITELTTLQTRLTEPEDKALVSSLLRAGEVQEPSEREEEQRHCEKCNKQWIASLLDEDDLCPDCVLLWMHEHFERRRRDAGIYY